MYVTDKPKAEKHPIISAPRWFAGLLVVGAYDGGTPNTSAKRRELDRQYVLCAANVSRSLKAFGYRFAAFTNHPDYVRVLLGEAEVDIDQIIQLETTTAFPEDLGFAAAHHKLDLFRMLGREALGPYVTFIDLDIEIVRPVPAFSDSPRHVIAYDLSAIMAYEFGESYVRDLEFVAGQTLNNRCWFGGEFLSAHAETFKSIATLSDQYMERYLDNHRSLVHVGDETLVSAALNVLVDSGVCEITDATDYGVLRYWTCRTTAPMLPLRKARYCAVMHLPADKQFLSRRATKRGRIPFWLDFILYAVPRILVRKLTNPITRIFLADKKFAPSL